MKFTLISGIIWKVAFILHLKLSSTKNSKNKNEELPTILLENIACFVFFFIPNKFYYENNSTFWNMPGTVNKFVFFLKWVFLLLYAFLFISSFSTGFGIFFSQNGTYFHHNTKYSCSHETIHNSIKFYGFAHLFLQNEMISSIQL